MRVYKNLAQKRFNNIIETNYDHFPTKMINGQNAILLYDSYLINKVLKPLSDKLGSPLRTLTPDRMNKALSTAGIIRDDESHRLASVSGVKVTGHYYYIKGSDNMEFVVLAVDNFDREYIVPFIVTGDYKSLKEAQAEANRLNALSDDDSQWYYSAESRESAKAIIDQHILFN